MRELDKKFYKALIFFDENTKARLNRLKNEELANYRRHVAEDVENDLYDLGYINPDPKSNRIYALTPQGQKELRVLDKIVSNKKAIIISIVAIIIAGISIIVNLWGSN